MNTPSQHKFPWSHLIPPFRYDPGSQMIFDADNHLVADIRGWGYLTGFGGLGMSDEEACKVQDCFGEWIAQAMTDCAIAERDGDNMQNGSHQLAEPEVDRLKAEIKRLRSLKAEIKRLRSLGNVFIPPPHWDYFGMGCGPSIEDFQQIDLSTY